jgi:hypothetical protein
MTAYNITILESAQFANAHGVAFTYYRVRRAGVEGWVNAQELPLAKERTQGGWPMVELIKDAATLGARI